MVAAIESLTSMVAGLRVPNGSSYREFSKGAGPMVAAITHTCMLYLLVEVKDVDIGHPLFFLLASKEQRPVGVYHVETEASTGRWAVLISQGWLTPAICDHRKKADC